MHSYRAISNHHWLAAPLTNTSGHSDYMSQPPLAPWQGPQNPWSYHMSGFWFGNCLCTYSSDAHGLQSRLETIRSFLQQLFMDYKQRDWNCPKCWSYPRELTCSECWEYYCEHTQNALARCQTLSPLHVRVYHWSQQPYEDKFYYGSCTKETEAQEC